MDTRSKDCPPDPFENEQKYPGVKIGARGKNVPVGSYYGYASGIVGLRLFPNPDFDEAAQKKWDAEKFYTDPKYYNDKNLVRPYRVGMSCGFCHVGPSPVKPPADPENPKWENLNSNPGAQYFWVDRILFWDKDESSFIYQLIHTSLPGTLDTSFISTDYINNPRTMNAVYSVAARLKAAERWGQEKLGGGGIKNKQFQDFKQTASLAQYYKGSGYGLDAAGTERRRGLRRYARRAQSGVHQHRTIQRRVAAAFQCAGGRQKDHADQNRGRREKFELLERDGGANSRCRIVLSQDGKAGLAEGCARGE